MGCRPKDERDRRQRRNAMDASWRECCGKVGHARAGHVLLAESFSGTIDVGNGPLTTTGGVDWLLVQPP